MKKRQSNGKGVLVPVNLYPTVVGYPNPNDQIEATLHFHT
jgi:hypothetical protein